MRSPFLLFFSLLVLIACGPDGQTGRIEGELKGIDQAVIMAHTDDALEADYGAHDSIKVTRGAFTYERHVEAPQLLTLVYPNFSTTTVVLEPGKTVRLKGDANRLKEVEVGGTRDNDLLNDFRQRALRTAPSNVTMEAASFIRSNAATMAAVALFREHFDAAEQRNLQPHLGLLDALVKAQPDNALVRSIDQRLRPQLLTSIGGKLPTFKAKNLKGEDISTAKLKGKPTLILFYASWDGDTYALRTNLRKLRTAYGSRLNTVLLSLDASRQEAEQHASRDTLTNVIHANGSLSSALARQLGVRYVPGGFLTNAKGEIVARDLPTEDWVNEVKKLLP